MLIRKNTLVPIFIVMACIMMNACTQFENRKNEQAIARVNDKLLLPSDVKDIFPPGLSDQDSLMILRNFTSSLRSGSVNF